MIPYILIFCLVALGFLYNLTTGKNNNFLYAFVVLIVLLMTGFRDMIGGYDIFNYASVFESTPPINELWSNTSFYEYILQRFEIGFIFFISICKFISSDKYFFFFIISLISYVLVGSAVSRYRLALFIFFIIFAKLFIVNFIYLRQILGMSIFWYSIRYLENNKRLPFILLTLLAASMHSSAIIVLPLVFIYRYRFSSKILIIMLIAAFLLGISPILKFVMEMFGTSLDSDKLVGYSSVDLTEIHLPYLIETFLLIALMIKYRSHFYKDQKNILLYNICVMYSLFMLLTLRDGGVSRMGWYFLIGYSAILAYSLTYLIKNKVLIALLILSYFSFVYFRNVIVRDSGNNIPYKSIFIQTKRQNIHE